MLTSKWRTLNHNCQKFNAIFKRFQRMGGRSGENELDFMNRTRNAYRQEVNVEDRFLKKMRGIFEKHSKLDASEPVDSVDLTGHDELFGEDVRPRPLANHVPPKKLNPKTSSSTAGINQFEFGDLCKMSFESNGRPQ